VREWQQAGSGASQFHALATRFQLPSAAPVRRTLAVLREVGPQTEGGVGFRRRPRCTQNWPAETP
jgi:hypothetical protein